MLPNRLHFSSIGRPKGAGRTAREKDPNKPKRPTSAYFYFAQYKREELARQGKSITRVADFTKEVSAEWKTLSTAARKPFEDKAKIDKERYSSEMSNYKGRKTTKDPSKPKRPCSAYFIFLAEFRVENKSKYSEHKDLIKAAGAAWQDMSDVEKKPYEKKAEEEKKKYNEAMATYNKGAAAGPSAKKAKTDNSNGRVEEDDDDDDDLDDEEDDD
ncbi:DgyrCDS14259 [Dimorphilus gyrociliatus]|uniref:DgyrCDS14259 n=1 Tax=Dimorphilus gyrociliatus TaxID=2664684 RepID=A0A7I8WDF3_9ANNE|nr:DgyrCDS14259 [Dimorphilus gyrociliatus]